mmetsp:Transcript_13159/g.25116  ORF Transcript_13159/g.25116 Transcript_13159/m.25116 type:complete len:151 (-) Transcript_13159:193-645(-)|eukprot:CAMPEP_0114232852 /NCGR_PEP_ID=MMETSP0058-20121206/4839_1 /TAXON_ID=36894 /ORGANISM="Pyramimonas parkeae, CCMP726" /LENGTH=150 /DNA_ID=CAMNT_0001344377 /DNA_START=313 /DNA_END=765 /DNA_ORIENTATION=-
MSFLEESLQKWGAGLSGGIFGAGWWVWLDAIATSSTKVPGDRWVPGIIATVALLMINSVRRENLRAYDPFDDGSDCRMRFWLFISYVVSFSSLVAAVWVLIQHYASNPGVTTSQDMWPGVAGVIQSTLILGSGLLFWLSRAPRYSPYGFY